MKESLSMRLLPALALLLTATGIGQTLITGDLTGRVTDTTGAGVARATVTLKSLDEGAVQTAETDGNGSYRFSLLRPGSYSIHEEGSGMTSDVPRVAVNVGQATTLNLVAKVSGNVTVEVNTNQPLLQAEDGNVSSTFNTAQIDSLPIPGGDISNLPFSTPGVALSTGAGYGNFTAFGLPGTSNVFTVNGSDLMDAYDNLPNSGASNNVLGANELSEAAVVVNGYTGQYGRLAGAQVNFTTKTGTNAFHGNALFYYNSSGLNANDWFLKQSQILGQQQAVGQGLTLAQAAGASPQKQPHAVSRQWGGSAGGPIWKDKLFFFVDSEGLRYVLPGGGTQTYLPSAAFQAATLTNIAAVRPSESAFYANVFKLYTSANGFATATPSTSSDGGCGDLAGVTGPGGITFGGGAGQTPCSVVFVPSNNNLNTEQLYTVRVDANLTAKDQLNARYRHDWGVQATSTDPINSLFSANSVQPEYDGQLNETHIFSPNVVNSATAGSLYYDAIFGPPNFAGATALFPTTFFFSDGDGFANLGGSDSSYPSGRNVTQYQFIDDLSITRGRHNIKLGFNFRRFDITNFAPQSGRTGSTSFTSNSDFYNGVISAAGGSTTTQAFSTISAGHLSLYDLAVYFQDQINLTNNLKMTASLRFDRSGNPACGGSCFVRLNAPFDQIAHGASIPYNQSILTNQRNAFNDIEKVTPQPRLGFAYSPFGPDGNTVIRGGAGLFADIFVPSVLTRFVTNAPNYISFTLSPSGSTSYLVDPSSSQSGYATLGKSYAAFQNGFTGGQTLAQIQAATAAQGVPFAPPNYSASVTNKLLNAKFVEYNLEVQRALSHNDVLDVNYVGNFANDILFLNPTANAYAACTTNNRCPGGYPGLPATVTDPRFTAVTTLTNNGHSNYNGVVASIRHQGGHGLTAAVNYTYSHSLDNTSNGGVESYAYNGSTGSSNPLTQIDPTSVDRLNYGSSDYDVRHNISLNYVYLPVFTAENHLLRQALIGYSISGTLFAKSGSPYSVLRTGLPSYYTGSTNGGSTLGALTGSKPGSCGRPSDICLVSKNFATRAQQALYGFGNQARNSYRGPMYFDTDVQLSKITPVREGMKLKFGANFFNVLNHPNFALPNNNLASSAFGTIQADTPPVSSPYGNFQGAGVSGRIIQVVGGITF